MTTQKIIFMTGCPGSGKSTTAKKILKQSGEGVILSTDDFFIVNGEYKWDCKFLSDAHAWAFGCFAREIFLGTKLVILDNTNLEAWCLNKYVELAAKTNIPWEIKEGTAKWKNDPVICAEKNIHKVPQSSIERMLAKKEDIKVMEKTLREKFKC